MPVVPLDIVLALKQMAVSNYLHSESVCVCMYVFSRTKLCWLETKFNVVEKRLFLSTDDHNSK